MENNKSIVVDLNMSVYLKDEPIAIRVVRSGWENQFHVLREFGDFEQTQYVGLMTQEQIREEFKIRVADFESLSSYTRRLPNDIDLGKTVRGVENRFKQTII